MSIQYLERYWNKSFRLPSKKVLNIQVSFYWGLLAKCFITVSLLSWIGSESFRRSRLKRNKECFSGLWPVRCRVTGSKWESDRTGWGNNAGEGQSWMTIGPRIRKLGWGGARTGTCAGPWGILRRLICSHGCLHALLNCERERSLLAFLREQEDKTQIIVFKNVILKTYI